MLLARKPGVIHHAFTPWLTPPEELARTLVGRDEVIKSILEKIKDFRNGHTPKHIIFWGPRGIGKTHILCFIHHYVAGHIQSRTDFPALSGNLKSILFAEEIYASLNTMSSLLLVLFEKLKEEDIHESLWELPVSLQAEPDKVVIDCCFERLRDFSKKDKYKILVLVDNIQKVFEQLPEDDHNFLRAFLNNQSILMLVGTAPTIFPLIADYKAPFYEYFERFPILDLTEEEMLLMLEALFHDDGLEEHFNRQKEDLRKKLPQIRKIIGGNPRLMLFLYDVITHSAFLEVEQALKQVIEELSEYFRSRLDALAPQPRKLLDTLAEMNGPATPTDIAVKSRISVHLVNGQLKRLINLGYVEKLKSKRGRNTYYDITERLFRIWRQTASIAGRLRFKLLAEFLKIYYTPDEMAHEIHSRTILLSKSISLDKEQLFRTLEELYYLQEASTGTSRYEVFKWRVEALINFDEYKWAIDEATYFLTESVNIQDKPAISAAYERLVELYIKTRKFDAALKNIANLIEMKELSKASIAIESFLEKSPDKAEAWLLRGIVAARLEQQEKSLESFKKASELEPEEAVYWVLQARALGFLKRYEEALDCAQKAVNFKPEMVLTWETLGLAAGSLGNHEKELESFKKASELEPEEAEYWRLQAVALRFLKRYEEALACAQKAVSLKPEMALAWQELGRNAGILGNHEKALESFKKASELKPEETVYWGLQAVALGFLERYEEALDCAQKAVNLKPEMALAWEALGLAAGSLGNHEKELESFKKASELEPEEAEYWRLQAVALRFLKRYEEAIDCAQKSVNLNPEMALAWVELGLAAGNLGNYEKALESFKKAPQLEPEEAAFWRIQALFLSDLERYQEALECLEQAIKIDNEDANLFLEKASVLNELGKIEEALAALEEASARKAPESKVFYMRGHLYLLSGRFRESKKTLEEGLPDTSRDWRLAVDYEIARACCGEHGVMMEELANVILSKDIPPDDPHGIYAFLIKIAEMCIIRKDIKTFNGLIRTAISIPDWQKNDWFRKDLGVFLRRLLDQSPEDFNIAIDLVKEKVVEQTVIEFLNPFIKAVEYSRTGDVAILDRLFPEVRELVLEISSKLGKNISSSG